jgi:hypothetical protein
VFIVTELPDSERMGPPPRAAAGRRRRAATFPAVGLAVLVTAAVTTGLTACSTVAPGPGPSGTSATGAIATATPGATEPLLPESTSSAAVGTLAAGFPVDLLPIPADAEVLVSAAEPVAGSTDIQVSLNLRTALLPADLIELYRAPLTAAGFTEAPAGAPNAALAAQATFTRSGGDEILVLGVLDRDNTRTLTLGGRVHKPA